MDLQGLARELHRSRERVERMRDDPTAAADVLTASLTELDLAHEELRVCQEEIETQQEELIRLRDDPADVLMRAYIDSPVPFLLLTRYGVVGRVNRAAAMLLGRSPGRLAGRPLAQHLRQADRPAFRSRLSATLRTAEAESVETTVEDGGPRRIMLTLWRSDAQRSDETRVAVLVSAPPPAGPAQASPAGAEARQSPSLLPYRVPAPAAAEEPRTPPRAGRGGGPAGPGAPELRELARQLAVGFADCVVIDLDGPGRPHRIVALASRDLPGPAGVRIRQQSPPARRALDPEPGLLGPTRVTVGDDLGLREALGPLAGQPFTGGSMMVARVFDDGVRGSVTLVRRAERAAFSRADRDRAQRTAEYLSLLGDEALRNEHHTDLAHRLRAAMLPRSLPAIPGAELSVAYHPSVGDGGFGGDFYDVFAGPHGWHLSVGDVCGKDSEAAATTGLVRNGLRVLCAEYDDPGAVLDRLNRVMLSDDACERFATVALTHVRPVPEGLEVALASAGHTRSLRMDAGGAVTLCRGGGLPAGLFEEARSETERFLLTPGDLLLLYTDGLTEARDGDGGLLGEDGLVAALDGLRSMPAGEAIRVVERRLEAFRGPHSDDDVVLLAVRAVGPGSRGRQAPCGA